MAVYQPIEVLGNQDYIDVLTGVMLHLDRLCHYE